jgi:leader peptidase (prepilin peptidase)/N-methyltransferase
MIIVILAIFGLILGSFVNAFVWRLHEQETLLAKKHPDKKQLNKLSIMHGRSMCPNCHHELAAKDLVPLLSWIGLGGKCRYCKKLISWQYPLVELVTALVFAGSYLYWPLALHGAGLVQFGFWLFFVVAFMALAVYDLRWLLLPNRIVYPLIVIAFIEAGVVADMGHSPMVFVNSVLGAFVISGLFYLLFQVSGGSWIGGGDVKLAVVLGLLAGTPLKALLLLFFASLVGTIVGVPLSFKARKGLKLRVPFGPFLLIATLIAVLFGSSMIDWYTRTLLG